MIHNFKNFMKSNLVSIDKKLSNIKKQKIREILFISFVI